MNHKSSCSCLAAPCFLNLPQSSPLKAISTLFSMLYAGIHLTTGAVPPTEGCLFLLLLEGWFCGVSFFILSSSSIQNILDVCIHLFAAHYLPQPTWMDQEGNCVDVTKSFGCKVQAKLDLPQLCIVMDKVAGDLNMLNDGHQGRTKYISCKGETAKINVTKKSKKFTMLGLTNLLGQPIMWRVIFEGKERNVMMESGIDPFHPKYNEYIRTTYSTSSYEDFVGNYGQGNLFPGGPVCEFEGHSIPTMIRYSEKGSITSKILTGILKTIDNMGIFQVYQENGAVPFLLVDSHQSRFSPKFLEYITNNKHLWKVTIGMPYGTSLWQVGDSYQQNGRFKIALVECKKKIMENRLLIFCSELELLPTNIMPMISIAWKASFADVIGNKEAIAERGLNPLNRNMLLLDMLHCTMTQYDKEEENKMNILSTKKLCMVASALHNKENTNEGNLNRSSLNFNFGYA